MLILYTLMQAASLLPLREEVLASLVELQARAPLGASAVEVSLQNGERSARARASRAVNGTGALLQSIYAIAEAYHIFS